MWNWRAVEIPKRLAKRPKDARGFPIPFIAAIDQTGKPQFTITDVLRHNQVVENCLCGLCGEPLYPKRQWLIGGPAAVMHPMGAFLDPPMHYECATYAMQVCPYIAAPNYRTLIDDRKFDYSSNPDMTLLKDASTSDDRPDLFLLACTDRISVSRQGPQCYVHPRKPWKAIEYWQTCRRLDDREGAALAEESLARYEAAFNAR